MKKERLLWLLALGFGLTFGFLLFGIFELVILVGMEANANLIERFGLWMVVGGIIAIAYAILYLLFKNAKKNRSEPD